VARFVLDPNVISQILGQNAAAGARLPEAVENDDDVRLSARLYHRPLPLPSAVGHKVHSELRPECRRPATQRVQLDVLCAPGLQLAM
jgi:hypothetical protein